MPTRYGEGYASAIRNGAALSMRPTSAASRSRTTASWACRDMVEQGPPSRCAAQASRPSGQGGRGPPKGDLVPVGLPDDLAAAIGARDLHAQARERRERE